MELSKLNKFVFEQTSCGTSVQAKQVNVISQPLL